MFPIRDSTERERGSLCRDNRREVKALILLTTMTDDTSRHLVVFSMAAVTSIAAELVELALLRRVVAADLGGVFFPRGAAFEVSLANLTVSIEPMWLAS